MAKITAKILIADEVNSNQRIYPKSVLEKIVEDCKDKPMIGQLGMPYWPKTSIDLDRAAFKCENFRMDGNELICDIESLDTFHGKLFEDITQKIPLAYSSIGVATTSTDGVVGDDFRLTGIAAISEHDWSFSKIGKNNDSK
jgi:hypothetical protein